jgi:hypothetical protein
MQRLSIQIIYMSEHESGESGLSNDKILASRRCEGDRSLDVINFNTKHYF